MTRPLEVRVLQAFGPELDPPDWMLCAVTHESAIVIKRMPEETDDAMRWRARAVLDAQQRNPDNFREVCRVRLYGE